MTTLQKYIYDKVNSYPPDKTIPYELIPDSLKLFWTEYYYANVIGDTQTTDKN